MRACVGVCVCVDHIGRLDRLRHVLALRTGGREKERGREEGRKGEEGRGGREGEGERNKEGAGMAK